jgi:hypothetical protein
MAYPFAITWPIPDVDYIAKSQALVSGTALTFASPIANQNVFSGEVSYRAHMPAGNVRTLSLTSASNLSAINFTILGFDPYGNLETETLAGPNANTVESVNYYSNFVYIVPSATSASLVSAGIGTKGYTEWYTADVYNKTSSYTIAYDTDASPGFQLTPYFGMNVSQFINGRQSTKSFAEWNVTGNVFAIPVTNANVICSSTILPVTIPIVRSASLSITGIPFQSLTTLVLEADGSFIQTIMQQGAKF